MFFIDFNREGLLQSFQECLEKRRANKDEKLLGFQGDVRRRVLSSLGVFTRRPKQFWRAERL